MHLDSEEKRRRGRDTHDVDRARPTARRLVPGTKQYHRALVGIEAYTTGNRSPIRSPMHVVWPISDKVSSPSSQMVTMQDKMRSMQRKPERKPEPWQMGPGGRIRRQSTRR